MGVFDFLKERPLQAGDEERVRVVVSRLNADDRYVVARGVNSDGSVRVLRIIDVSDRVEGDESPQFERTEALVRLLRAAVFEAYKDRVTNSSWGDITVGQRNT